MSSIFNGIKEAKRSPEPDYNDPSWDEKVSNVGQKAKQAELLKSKGKEPRTRWNPETKKYYVDFSDDDVQKESVGLPYPGTYEETNDMFKSSGQRRIGSLTTEDEQIDGMAQGEIREIIKNAVHIKNQLDKGVSLDGWMYSFVTVSNDKLNSVAEQINNPHIDEEQLNELFDAQQEYYKLADGQVVQVDYKQDLNADGQQGSIKVTPANPKLMPMSGLQAIHNWDKARPNIRTAIQKWVQSGQQGVAEGWSQKYKSSINCSHPKGFSQKAHCAGKKKHNESIPDYSNLLEMTCPDCGMCQTHSDHKNLDEACWKGYHKEGNKKMFGKTYPNCVKNEDIAENDLDKYKKYTRPVVKTTPKIERTTNPAGRTTDHVEYKVTSPTGEIHRYKSKKQAQEHFDSFSKQDVAEDKENYNGINILLQKNDDELFVKASAGSRELGHVLFVIDGEYLMPQDLEVEEKFRGQGIAQTMYDYVKSKGYKIRRSGQQTDAGAGFWDKHRPEQNVWEQGVAEGVPQPGESSGAPKKFGPDAKIEPRQMTVKQIISSIPGVPYYNNVVDDWDAKDYSWGVTKKVIEYATYLKDHPESLSHLPPILVLNGKFEDGAHRVSAIWLLQQRMDPKNPLWANAKLNVQFVKQGVAEGQHSCPHCGGVMVSEELMNEKKDACYYKVKSRYKVWPSAYASGALVKCRKSHGNWGNGGKKNESSILEGIERADENLHQWFKEKWVRFGPDGKIRGACARGDDSEGKPKCLPQSKAQNLGKKGRASAAARKRREDPNPDRHGPAINVNTKKKSNESIDEGWFKNTLAGAALAGAALTGAGHAQAADLGQFGTTYLQQVASGEHPRPMVSIDDAKAELQAREQGKQQTVAPTAKPETSSGYSIDYLKKAADPDRTGRYLISVEKAQEMLNQATAPRARPALNIAPGDYPAAK